MKHSNRNMAYDADLLSRTLNGPCCPPATGNSRLLRITGEHTPLATRTVRRHFGTRARQKRGGVISTTTPHHVTVAGDEGAAVRVCPASLAAERPVSSSAN